MAKTYVYTDPRELEGSPYEVADAAAKQAKAALELTHTAVVDLFVMARVAEMERECQRGDEPDGRAFGASPQGLKLQGLALEIEEMGALVDAIGIAAAYDPKRPVPA